MKNALNIYEDSDAMDLMSSKVAWSGQPIVVTHRPWDWYPNPQVEACFQDLAGAEKHLNRTSLRRNQELKVFDWGDRGRYPPEALLFRPKAGLLGHRLTALARRNQLDDASVRLRAQFPRPGLWLGVWGETKEATRKVLEATLKDLLVSHRGQQQVHSLEKDLAEWKHQFVGGNHRKFEALLIEGETGTGKTVTAQYYHNLACPGHPESLYEVNSSGLDARFLQSDLFGSLEGSFTGSTHTNAGKILEAFFAPGGGSLFLDELGELDLGLQAQLLKYLDSGQIEPLGWSGPTLRFPVRLIAATNRNIPQMVREGKFRQDLYERFHHRVELPTIRQDTEAITLFVARKLESKGKRIESQAMNRLFKATWAGNLRDLSRTLDQAVRASGTEPVVTDDDLGDLTPGPLETTDVAVLIVKKEEKFLLLWDGGYRQYFLVAGRIDPEKGDLCPWDALERALRTKMQWNPVFTPVADARGRSQLIITDIHHSLRANRLKHYRYHAFGITLSPDDQGLGDSFQRGMVRWATRAEIRQGAFLVKDEKDLPIVNRIEPSAWRVLSQWHSVVNQSTPDEF